MTDIDWDALRSAAREAATRSYSPYSHYPVGAAALTDLGHIVTGANVVLSTPTGTGKSLVAVAGHAAALAAGRRSYYTAPIKALVSEKFFDLCETFGAANVGMLTGDAAVNPGAPIVSRSVSAIRLTAWALVMAMPGTWNAWVATSITATAKSAVKT